MNFQAVEMKSKAKKTAVDSNRRKDFDLFFERADKKMPVYADGKKTGETKIVSYGQFKMSLKAFDQLGLATKGLKQYDDLDSPATALGVVSESEASIFKPSKKGKEEKEKSRTFKGEALQNRLVSTGVLPESGDCKIYLTLTEVATELAGVESMYVIDVENTSGN